MQFDFMLARDLGMTVNEMRSRMSTAEYTEWFAFYQWEAREREKAEKSRKR